MPMNKSRIYGILTVSNCVILWELQENVGVVVICFPLVSKDISEIAMCARSRDCFEMTEFPMYLITVSLDDTENS